MASTVPTDNSVSFITTEGLAKVTTSTLQVTNVSFKVTKPTREGSCAALLWINDEILLAAATH